MLKITKESEVNKLMARSMYQYETSPRKIEPEYTPRTKRKLDNQKNEKEQIKELEEKKQKKNALKLEKRKHHKNIAVIVGIFLMLLTISYRNSLITEKFNEIQNKKSQLAAVEKTNGQAEVSIESSLNLKNIEKSAKKKLGMQKLENDQKVYVTLPKKDYTESALPEVEVEENTNWFQNLLSKLFK